MHYRMGTLDDEGTVWCVSPGPELNLQNSCAHWTHVGLLVGLRVKSGCAANPSGPGSSSQLKKMAVLSPRTLLFSLLSALQLVAPAMTKAFGSAPSSSRR